MYLENKKIVAGLAIKLAAMYELNAFDVCLALCRIMHKYHCQTLADIEMIFHDKWNKYKQNNEQTD